MKAGALNHGLAPRESLLIAADSLMASLFASGPAGLEYWSGVRRLFRTVDEAAARYPDDPLVWNTVGEARAHLGSFVDALDAWELEPFDRAIAVDSAFAPAYIHPVEIGLHIRGPAERSPVHQRLPRARPDGQARRRHAPRACAARRPDRLPRRTSNAGLIVLRPTPSLAPTSRCGGFPTPRRRRSGWPASWPRGAGREALERAGVGSHAPREAAPPPGPPPGGARRHRRTAGA